MRNTRVARWLGLSVLSALLFGTSASAAVEGQVRFAVPNAAKVDFVRVYVGLAPRSYEVSVDLKGVRLNAKGEATATDAGLARVLSQPKVYYVTMTAVDTSGRESSFSNELKLDFTRQNCPAGTSCAPQPPVVNPTPKPKPAPKPPVVKPAPKPKPAPAKPAPSKPKPTKPKPSKPEPTKPSKPAKGKPSKPRPAPQASNTPSAITVSIGGKKVTRGKPIRVVAGVPIQLSAIASDREGLGFPALKASMGSNRNVVYLWNFGGALPANPKAGLPTIAANPEVRFIVGGKRTNQRFNLRLDVYDRTGDVTRVNIPVVAVRSTPPRVTVAADGKAVKANARLVHESNKPISFSIDARDPDGIGFPIFLARDGNPKPVAVQWNFGGGVPRNAAQEFALNPVVRFPLNKNQKQRVFRVSVTAYDATGASTIHKLSVMVRAPR